VSAQCPYADYQNNQNLSSCDIDLDIVPVKHIRIIYHVFQKDDGSENIPDSPDGRDFIEGMHDHANFILRNLDPMTHATTSGYVPDSKVQYNNMGIYFWQDDIQWSKGSRFNGSHGTSMYNYVMQQNVSFKSNSIHVLIPGNFGADSGPGGRASGIGDTRWSMLEDVYYRYTSNGNYTGIAALLNHEIGHNCSVRHPFEQDYCDDTSGHLGPFQNSNDDNNMLGYNGRQNSLTEDQITRWHHFLQEESDIVTSGNFEVSLDGFLSNSGANGGPILPTTNTKSSSATLTIQGQNLNDIDWDICSGSGTISVSNDGTVVSITGLGAIHLKVSWTTNCVNFSKSFSLFNQPF